MDWRRAKNMNSECEPKTKLVWVNQAHHQKQSHQRLKQVSVKISEGTTIFLSSILQSGIHLRMNVVKLLPMMLFINFPEWIYYLIANFPVKDNNVH